MSCNFADDGETQMANMHFKGFFLEIMWRPRIVDAEP